MDRVANGESPCSCNKATNIKDITGRRFGRLLARNMTEQRDKHNGAVIWECECDCGNVILVSSYNLRRGSVKSCGCLGRENSVQNAKTASDYVKENFCVGGTNALALKKKSVLGASGIKGVTWDKNRNKWRAQIGFKNKNYYLGRYEKLEDAAKARQEAEEQMFDNFLEWYAETYPDAYKKINNKK